MDMATADDTERWLDHLFSAKAVARGGVIRRSVAWVEHEIGRERFIGAVAERGFSLLECGGQFVVICQRGPIRRLL
ncbi:N-(5'-phosphoribosyl)anthranilate isomerase [Acidimangrovimonas sediminis]|uniref:N-(5'-phosphoribosyl)anthranilate isomerase n=1 Tax=Acidimangrovimonas sediminis TaxID=2056283 RepID=UPI001E58EC9D|nr:N-(5'-phosphoribosyl)anthranilate isomerase [Acidimangrovimonas sediminis]